MEYTYHQGMGSGWEPEMYKNRHSRVQVLGSDLHPLLEPEALPSAHIRCKRSRGPNCGCNHGIVYLVGQTKLDVVTVHIESNLLMTTCKP